MERCKIALGEKNIRLPAAMILLAALALFITGQLAAARMAADFKSAMVRHDYAVAGYLASSGVSTDKIIPAFTSEKTAQNGEAGEYFLKAAGYSAETPTLLLSEAESMKEGYSRAFLAAAIFFSLLVFGAFIAILRSLDRSIEDAAIRLGRFMDGDTYSRLPDCGEGSLSRLYCAVNAMATSLTSHIDKETQSRLFLKDTISDISHQLKTPLAALSMYNEIIAEENLDNSAVASFTEKSRRELTRMEGLIQSLLKLTKLDAGTIELEILPRRLLPFLEKCAVSFATRAEMEGKSISVSCSESVSLGYDEVWLFEAVGNIVKNALDHTGEGGKIEILCLETLVATEIIISDNGSGIHPEDLHHIFKRFYRSRFSKDRQGVGIGLSLTKAIVENHGGAVAVKSEPGRGAEFRLIFPKLYTKEP